MMTGLVITIIGMVTVFLLLAIMISVVKIISLIYVEKKSGSGKSKEDREIAIALAALKNVLG